MFYRESYNNLWYEKNPQIIEIFDHLLGTLVGDIVNRITVSFIAEKTRMQYEMAKQIVIYLYWTRRPSRSYAKAGMNRPAGVKTAHSCGHTSS